MKRVFFILLFLIANKGFSAPSISGVDGVITHGSTITISGSGFSTGGAIDIFDTLESGSFNAGWEMTNSDLVINSDNNRHSNSSKNATYDFDGGSGDAWFKMDSDVAQNWYVSYWFKLATNWDWGDTGFEAGNSYLANVKVFRLWNPGSTDENLVAAIEGWAVSGTGEIHAVVENVTPGYSAFFLQDIHSNFSLGDWHHLQFEWQDSAVNVEDGIFRVWFDGSLVEEDTSVEGREDESGFKRPLIIGFSEVWGTSGDTDGAEEPNDFYIDDVYSSQAWNRIEISTNSTYEVGGSIEMQDFDSWSATSIDATLMLGEFDGGTTVYAYVTDSSGSKSSGFQLLVGGEGGGPSPSPSPSPTPDSLSPALMGY